MIIEVEFLQPNPLQKFHFVHIYPEVQANASKQAYA
jgi:hypothetical protein